MICKLNCLQILLFALRRIVLILHIVVHVKHFDAIMNQQLKLTGKDLYQYLRNSFTEYHPFSKLLIIQQQP